MQASFQFAGEVMEVVPLLECGSSVVQLSLCDQSLLISTLARSLLLDMESGRVTQVGPPVYVWVCVFYKSNFNAVYVCSWKTFVGKIFREFPCVATIHKNVFRKLLCVKAVCNHKSFLANCCIFANSRKLVSGHMVHTHTHTHTWRWVQRSGSRVHLAAVCLYALHLTGLRGKLL